MKQRPVCECGHQIVEHELVDHGAVSDYTRIIIREHCTKCPCKKWKAVYPPKENGK